MDILVVDDHKLFLEGVAYVLQNLEANTHITTIANYDEAFAEAEKADQFELILLDLNISDADGVALLNHYGELGIYTPVVVISATEDVFHIKSALDSGALGFIPKSYSGDEMLAALHKILAGEIFLPATIAKEMHARQAVGDGKLESLTKRQKTVLALLASGASNKEIAGQLFLTENTVKSHVMTLFQKLNVKNRTECVLVAQENCLINV
jgi:DNA-binding NarL/FixJ family response regulator